jgi:hypothetical protein
MDEFSEEALKTSVSLVIQPIASVVQDAVGFGGGDWLHELRERNRQRLRQKTKRILDNAGVERIDEPNPVTIAPIISAAQDESREELQDIWAKLLAAALDPARNKRFRREFVAAIKQFELNDALVLLELHNEKSNHGRNIQVIEQRTGLSRDQVAVSYRNLISCGCFMQGPGVQAEQFPVAGVFVSPLGRELLEVVLVR